MDKAADLARYVDLALGMGAAHSVGFETDDIVFDPRTILKCMFGCTDWGKGPTCPSRAGSLMPWEYEQVLKRYSWGVIVHSPDKHIAQKASYEIERLAFLDGYYLAFSMSDCAWCAKCASETGGQCVHTDKARPAFHSVGIDVFATARHFDLPIQTLKSEDEPQNWYAAVWIE